MKKYEFTALYDEILEDDIIKAVEEKVTKYAKITKIEDDGINRLAYPIRGHDKAHFKFYHIELDEKNLHDLNYELNYNTDEIMRFLIVTVDNRNK